MKPTREPVKFMTIEDDDNDLIVSFAIADESIWGVLSLTLLRTPNFEFALPEEERGVNVSHESFPEKGLFEMLRRIRISPPTVTIETTRRQYELDVSAVEPDQIQSSLRMLERMNFDARFVLEQE
jgi:hypothetical protein